MMEKVQELLKAGKRKEAIEVLEEAACENGGNEEMLLQLGELINAEGRMADALNKFNAVLRLNPENQKARNYVMMINNIFGYYCKDMFNP